MAGRNGIADDPSLDTDDDDLGAEGAEVVVGAEGAGDVQIEFAEEADEKFEESGDSTGEGGEGPDADEISPGTGDANEEQKRFDREIASLTKAGMSKAMTDRLQRERRVVRHERALREDAERRQIESAKEAAILRMGMTEVAEKNIDAEMKSVRAELIAAKEAGETEKEVDLSTQLQKLASHKADIERMKPDIEARAKAAREGGIQQGGTNPLTTEWKARNRWFGNPKFVSETRYAALIDQEMAVEGKSPHDPTYFTEWDRRIRERMPAVHSRWRQESGEGGGGPRSPARRGPGSMLGGGQNQPAVRSAQQLAARGKVIITAADKESMRNFGLDPSNRAHLQQFARERLATNQGGR